MKAGCCKTTYKGVLKSQYNIEISIQYWIEFQDEKMLRLKIRWEEKHRLFGVVLIVIRWVWLVRFFKFLDSRINVIFPANKLSLPINSFSHTAYRPQWLTVDIVHRHLWNMVTGVHIVVGALGIVPSKTKWNNWSRQYGFEKCWVLYRCAVIQSSVNQQISSVNMQRRRGRGRWEEVIFTNKI